MNYDAMPRLRFEIESMKSTILTHLGTHGSELGEMIDKSIDGAIRNYPFDEKVKNIVNEAISRQLERYFSYGDGAKAIEETIHLMRR